MAGFRILVPFLLVISMQLVLLTLHEAAAAPSGYSISSAGGSGAIAGTDDDGQAVAMSGVPIPNAPSSKGSYSGGTIVSGGSGGSSSSLLSRSGGSASSKPKTQTVFVGSNGDSTTILQQNDDNPPKVYKING